MQNHWRHRLLLGAATLTAGLASAIVTYSPQQISARAESLSTNMAQSAPQAPHAALPGPPVQPSDWAFQALQSLAQRYGCIAGSAPGGLGNQALSRYEFATALNACLDRISALVAARSNPTSRQDLATLQRLQTEFAPELASLRGRVDALETRTAELESTQRSIPSQQNGAINLPAKAPPPPALAHPRPQFRAAPGDISLSNGYATSGAAPSSTAPQSPVATGTVGQPRQLRQALRTRKPHPTGVSMDEDTAGFGSNLTQQPGFDREGYNPIQENPFLRVGSNPLSTFSIDVDAASYSNVRRFINSGQRPPRDAVRLEELINYFTYDYPDPKGKRPFSITTEVSQTPWNPKHQLVHIGLQGKRIATQKLPPNNLVFLLDVSGSMHSPDKLPLVKSAMKLLVEQLREQDSVTMVVYAGAAGLVLPPTSGNEKTTILEAIEQLQAGGSTAGGAGIQLAYKMAQENFNPKGNNRVILATDGDFNVGISSDAELVQMIEEKRQNGVFLSVLGFGTGNLQDAKMEQLADKGNGNYAYIDSIREARKVLVNEMGATLLTIAKDVKLQVEFNPTKVQAYRLIGYENRLLRDEDFHDDTKDAGELGAGHTVTALYEIIPVGVDSDAKLPPAESLRYQQTTVNAAAYDSDELMQVQLRYKRPDRDKSKLIAQPVVDRDMALEDTSANFKFSAAVAGFGLLLRDSQYKGKASFEQVLRLAQQSKGEDPNGYRAEFIQLVRSSQKLMAAEQPQQRAER